MKRNDESIPIYSFNIDTKKMRIHFGNIFPDREFELGEYILDFINFDFSEYESLRHKIKLFYDTNSIKLSSLDIPGQIEYINIFFPDFKEHHCFEYAHGEYTLALCYYLYTKIQFALNYYFPVSFFEPEWNLEKMLNNEEFDFLNLQSKFKNIIEKLLDVDCSEYKNIDPVVRFVLLSESMDFPQVYEERTNIYPNTRQKITEGFSAFAAEFNEENPQDWREVFSIPTAEKTAFIKDHFRIVTGYRFNKYSDALYCETLKMVEAGILVKKCKNCGKYFLFKPTQPAEYCTKIYPGTKLTCQQIGSQKDYVQKLSPIKSYYQKAQRRRFNLMPLKASGLRTPQIEKDYSNWKKKHSQIMKEYEKKYLSTESPSEKEKLVNEFKQIIEKSLKE